MANTFTSSTSFAQREQIGKYHVLQELDSNRPGTLYLVEEPNTRRRLALKLPTVDPQHHDVFHDEARRLMRLEHEHIVPILDAGEADGVCFLVVEMLKGQSLQDRLKREHRLPLKESLRIAREVASALAFVHAHGLCHRDICPMNVWLEPSGRARLLGFGESCSTEADPLLSRLDGVGSPGYLSPEQAAGEAIAPASDLFSFGCVLYHMTTGERPFRGESSAALLRAVVFEHPTSVRQINPEIPESLDELVTRLLAKMPAERPESAQEVEHLLMEWLDPIAPKPRFAKAVEPLSYPASKRILDAMEFLKEPAPSPPGRKWPSEIPYAEELTTLNRGWLVDVIAAILLFAASGGLYYWWKTSNEPPQPAPSMHSQPKH